MSRVLITGGSGFIGRYLIKEFMSKSVECLSIDNIIDSRLKCESKEASILDEDAIKGILKDFKPDAIVHLAAIALVTYGDVADIYKVNVCGTETLLKSIRETCPKHTRVVMISTAGVYGNQDSGEYDESLPYNPENHYSFSKMITEFIAKQYSDLDIKIVRPFNIIGVGQKNTFLIPKLIEHFAAHKEELRVGNLEATRDYVDVEYCASILAELALREKIEYNVLNICSGEGHSVSDVIEFLSEQTGYSPKVIVDPQFVRENEVWKLVGSPTRLLDFMQGKKCRKFEDTIEQMLNYYITNKE